MRLIIILALGFTSLLQAQKPFLLKNETSNKPIPFATIWTQNKVLTSSDSLGAFYIDDSYLNSNFKITTLGYKTFDSIIGHNMQIIYLKSSIIELKEVHISKTTSKRTIKVGKLNNGDAAIIAEKNKEVAQVGKFFENKMNEKLFLSKIKLDHFVQKRIESQQY